MRPITGHTDLTDALRGSGVVGNDLLAVDWERTPLGAPGTWPSSLRTMVRVVLSSRFAMWMAWGPDLTFFCNDAYRRETLGEKYPWALGRPAREVWAEIWPEIGPRIEHVLETGEGTFDQSLLLFLERSGYEEESYHTFSYSPVHDDDGAIAGMLCVVTEETERVIGERRIATLRDLNSVSTAAVDEHAFLKASAAQLAGNPRSLPFICIYTFSGDRARLAATTGAEPGDPVAPVSIEMDDAQQLWPARELAAGISDWIVVDGIQQRCAWVPTGAWPTPPFDAVAVALPGPADSRPVGFIVVGVNHYRPVDDVYRGFIGTIAQRLGAGVTNARSYAAERERAEQLAELDRAKTAFFSNVSHEFRTPLTLMLAPLQDALQAEAALADDQLEIVHRNGLRLLKLVDALLDFSKLEAGRMRASFRPVNAAALTGELVGTFNDACRRAGLTLETDCEEPADQVYLDPDLWERVVLNLVSNAFKVTVSGGIRVSLRAENEMLVLSVADTGPGIPTEEQKRIFERFHRIRGMQARSHEGTGIGLALVQDIVELHGGRIDVHSVVGEGAEFVVQVPLGRDHLPSEYVSDEPAATTGTVADLFVQEALSWLPGSDDGPLQLGTEGSLPEHGARVLVVDDNPDLRRYLTRLLSPFWSVETADDGLRALETIRQRPPALVVTDVMMPRLDGFGLLQELRASPETQDLPVIMLSARAGEEAAIEGLESGADDYLGKPFSGRELLARVRAHLELSLARQAASADLRAERAMLEQTLTQLPVGVVLAEAPEDEIVLANEQIGVIFGREGIQPGEIRPLIYDRLYLSDRTTLVGQPGLLTRAIRDHEVIENVELSYRRDDGRWRTILTNAAPVVADDGSVVAAVAVLEDITERVRGQKLLAGQRDVMAMIANGEPLEQMLNEVVRVIEGISSRGAMASILLVSPDRQHLVGSFAPSLPEAYNRAINGIIIGEGIGSCGTAAYRREPVVVGDIQTDPLWTDFRELAGEHGLRACWSTPIFATGGRVIGTFAVYHSEPHVPTPEDREAVELLARTAAVAIERARDAELRANQLSELQTSLLPPALPDVPGLQAAASFHSGDRSLEVGGDFYDLFALDEGVWGLVVGDVCGHGAEAAAVTALARHSAWSHARMHERPNEVLASVSEAISARGYGRYCTAIYGRLERLETRTRLLLAVGGHPPPMLRRADGTVEILREHGPLLGVLATPRFPVTEILLEPGDALLLYTDGLIERNPWVTGEEGLARILARLPDTDAEELLAELENAALGPKPRRPRDDVAMLVVKQPGV
jgi:signal transduction histidine kinase/serine phosphatase RsbU (regulator of sigma subunit)/FixJ family two-component response regulator